MFGKKKLTPTQNTLEYLTDYIKRWDAAVADAEFATLTAEYESYLRRAGA